MDESSNNYSVITEENLEKRSSYVDLENNS